MTFDRLTKLRGANRRGMWTLVWAAGTFAAMQLAALVVVARSGPVQRFNEAGLTQTPRLEDSIVNWQVCHALASSGPVDVLCLGDSSCLMGVMPEEITARTGRSAWNVGTLGVLTIDGHVDILDLYVRTHGAPKLILYHVSYFPFDITPAYLKTFEEWPQRFRQWGVCDNPVLTDPTTWLPSCRLNQLALARVQRHFQGQEEREKFLSAKRGSYPSDHEVRDFLWQSHGFMQEVPITFTPKDWDQHVKDHKERVRVKIVPECVPPLQRLFDFAQKRGIPLIVAMEPVPEPFRHREVDDAYDSLGKKLRELAAPYPVVQIDPLLLRYYSTDDCKTIVHLQKEGPRRNTAELTERLIGPFFAPAGQRAQSATRP